MNADRERDRLLEDALEHQLAAQRDTAATSQCLDAETMAAWMDGGLDAESMAMAESHASGCARCQAMLGAMGRTAPVAPITVTQGARLWRWWFAPLAATSAAVTIWLVVPPQPMPAPVEAPAQEAFAQPPVLAAPREAGQPPAAAAPPQRSQAQKQAAPPPPARERRAAPDTLPMAQAPAPAPPAAAPEAVTVLADAAAATRSSPSPDVIWTVGPAGLVQLATDGLTFVRLPFPEAVDLVSVIATDARHATVATSDGRVFETADGGRTWTRP